MRGGNTDGKIRPPTGHMEAQSMWWSLIMFRVAGSPSTIAGHRSAAHDSSLAAFRIARDCATVRPVRVLLPIATCVLVVACDEPIPESGSDDVTSAVDAVDDSDSDSDSDTEVDVGEPDAPPHDVTGESDLDVDVEADADAREPDLSLPDAGIPGDAPRDLPVEDTPADLSEDPATDVPADADVDAVDDDVEPDVDAHTLPDLGPPPSTTYLVHSANDLDELWVIDVATGAHIVVCEFEDDIVYPSITFSLDGDFYGAGMGQLDQIDPCTCEVTPIGEIGYDGLGGITANGLKDWELYGLTFEADLLILMDVEDGAGRPVGELGRDFGFCGTTWSSTIDGLYAIDSNTDALYQIDTETGRSHSRVPLASRFGTVGIEWHPLDEELYACSGSDLYRVDQEDGSTVSIPSALRGCNNLAAPWTRVSCLEELFE